MIITAFHGFCMALADSVPGVSGGTVAFILGFYERLLAALHNLFGKDAALRRESIVYLMKLGLGWCIGLGSSVMILAKVFEANIYLLSSLFLGLTAAAIPFIIISEKEALSGKYYNLIYTILGAAAVWALTAGRAVGANLATIDFLSLNFAQFLYIMVAGMVAITAMVLPGISGSTLLLIFGLYVPTVDAVRQVLQLHLAYLPGLAALGTGIVLGAALAIKWIRMGLKNYRSQMIYLILGLMVGSFYAIAMGPTTLPVPQNPMGISNFHVIGFIAGVMLLLGLEMVRKELGAEGDTAA